jgi:uracil-DNA glycosylase
MASIGHTDHAVGTTSLNHLLTEIKACTVCAPELPHEPNPVVQLGSGAKIVIIGQAPGRRVHESGIPWDDPSGNTLREWLGVSSEQFYDPDLIALVPMGFCFPGSNKSGDKPPRKECAPLWHERVLAELPSDRLTILIGMYAQRHYLAERKANLTETVAEWASYLPSTLPLPHPSPRNRHWLTKNPWFETDTLPALKRRVAEALTP